MTEYIERKKLLKLINNWKRDDVIPIIEGHIVGYPEGWNEALEQIESDIEDIPAADVMPVVHARWEIGFGGCYPCCSNCGEETEEFIISIFCPNCGAKMDGR